MKPNECDAKNVCDNVVSDEERGCDRVMMTCCIVEKIRQRESEFISRLVVVFLLLGGVCLVAALASKYFWESVFHLMYETGGFADKATEVATIQDYQALKPLVNLTMYAIPNTLGFIGIGFILMVVLVSLVDSASNLWRRYQQRRRCKRAGR